jgi:DNA-binding MarR family transcriptional regulator
MRRLAVSAWLRTLRVFQKMDRALAGHLRDHDISLAQFDVLAHVGAAEGMTQQELADQLLVTKGNVCQLLDRLTQSGLLVRQQDGRTNRLYLTPAGRTMFDRVVPAHEAIIEHLLKPLTTQEQQHLVYLLRKLERGLD